MKNKTPVIIVCYKRPIHLLKILERLKIDEVDNLYILSDAAKNPKDKVLVDEVREIICNIKWIKPKVKILEENHGCGKAIPLSINWVLQENERVILLEDDVVPRKYFIHYMESCLDKYENNDKVFGIFGNGLILSNAIKKEYPYDAYFFPIVGSDSWATWRRAWKYYDPDLKRLYEKSISEKIELVIAGKNFAPGVLRKLDDPTYDVWTLNWVLSCYLNHACYVYPVVAQVDNIGYDGTGVHCNTINNFITDKEEKKIERLPNDVVFNPAIIDHYSKFYNTGIIGE
jgi:hypothetical protein